MPSLAQRDERARSKAVLALVACLLLAGPVGVLGALPEQLVVSAGMRLSLVPLEQSGLAGLALYFPAGTAETPDNPALARLAPRLFLGETLEGEQEALLVQDFLAKAGWSLKLRCDLDGAGVFLAGPARDLDRLLHHLLARLAHPERFSEAALEAAWKEFEADRRDWAENPEVRLRAQMARREYGDHPYAVGLGQNLPAGTERPDPALLGDLLARYYQAGAAEMLVAGPFETEEFLAQWLPDFDALPGEALPPVRHPEASAPQGEREISVRADATLLILDLPGVPGSSGDAPALTLVAGVLQQLLHQDVVSNGMARGASAYYDYTAPGPRPLEIQVRQFPADNRAGIEERLERIFDRLREGQFSEYQVITAKDRVFQTLDASRVEAGAPPAPGPRALMDWSWNVLRLELHFDRWRDLFETRLLGTGKERISAEARKRLFFDEGTLGLILPSE